MVSGEERTNLCDFVLEKVRRSQWVDSSYYQFRSVLVHPPNVVG